MNWLGELVQKEIGRHDTVLDLGCGTMQATMDTCPTYKKTRLKCRHITGVDTFRSYLNILKFRPYITVLNMPLPSGLDAMVNKSFDVVMALDLIEHLKERDARQLILKAERIALKKVILYTPNHWYENEVPAETDFYPYHTLGINPNQRHQWLVPIDYLRGRGYKVSTDNPDNNTFAVKDMPPVAKDVVKEFDKANREAVADIIGVKAKVRRIVARLK